MIYVAIAPEKGHHGSKRHIRRADVPPARRATVVDWVVTPRVSAVMVVMMHSVLGVELAAGQTGFHASWFCDVRQAFPGCRISFLISWPCSISVVDRRRLAHLSRPQGCAFAYFLRAVGEIQFGFKAPAFAARAVGAMWLSLSGILHRVSFRHAVVHLSAAVFFVVIKGQRGGMRRS